MLLWVSARTLFGGESDKAITPRPVALAVSRVLETVLRWSEPGSGSYS